MSVEFYRESPGKFDSRTLNRKTLNRWTGRTVHGSFLIRRKRGHPGVVHRLSFTACNLEQRGRILGSRLAETRLAQNKIP